MRPAGSNIFHFSGTVTVNLTLKVIYCRAIPSTPNPKKTEKALWDQTWPWETACPVLAQPRDDEVMSAWMPSRFQAATFLRSKKCETDLGLTCQKLTVAPKRLDKSAFGPLTFGVLAPGKESGIRIRKPENDGVVCCPNSTECLPVEGSEASPTTCWILKRWNDGKSWETRFYMVHDRQCRGLVETCKPNVVHFGAPEREL